MRKIDRLGWAAGFSFEAYGLLIGFRTNEAWVLEHARRQLPFGWVESKQPEVEQLYSFVAGGSGATGRVRRFHVVYSDAFRLERTLDFDLALAAFAKDLELFVGEEARGRVFVHAGVVGWRGRAIMLPGRSFSGKSSLVAALIRCGATFYSDEFAILDEQGLVHPFARPLSIREEGSFEGVRVPVEELGGQEGRDALPVGAVFVSNYQRDARWRPRRISPGRAILEIISHTLSSRSHPDFVLPVLHNVVRGAPVFKTRRGEADVTARAILDLVG